MARTAAGRPGQTGPRSMISQRHRPLVENRVELTSGRDAELHEDLAQVVLNGLRADEQALADLGVRQPVARQAGDLVLLGGQFRCVRGDDAFARGFAGGE